MKDKILFLIIFCSIVLTSTKMNGQKKYFLNTIHLNYDFIKSQDIYFSFNDTIIRYTPNSIYLDSGEVRDCNMLLFLDKRVVSCPVELRWNSINDISISYYPVEYLYVPDTIEYKDIFLDSMNIPMNFRKQYICYDDYPYNYNGVYFQDITIDTLKKLAYGIIRISLNSTYYCVDWKVNYRAVAF